MDKLDAAVEQIKPQWTPVRSLVIRLDGKQEESRRRLRDRTIYITLSGNDAETFLQQPSYEMLSGKYGIYLTEDLEFGYPEGKAGIGIDAVSIEVK